ncbi:MAG: polysaccharide biosynthesis/export family protein [Planctomycetaceae bacterium]|nr:polysaccharide biosynthesis/export family protein [Planctomycetaceae bacterium]
MHETSSHNLVQASLAIEVRALNAGFVRQSESVCRNDRATDRSRGSFSVALCLAMLTVSALSGCAAVRPLDGVPARFLPEELKGCSRENRQMIDLSYLRQQAPAEYLVDSGDVLAIYIESVLGQRDQPPINQPLDTTQPPTLGYPLTIRDDGTLSLPLIQPIFVRGKTIPQVEREIRHAYTVGRRLLLPGQDRIVVTLHKPRQHRILVIRQELQSDILSGVSVSGGSLGTAKKGTGHVVSLPAYKNDVLNALVQSGGLPGLDAENVVYIMRGRRARPVQPQPQQLLPAQPAYGQPNPPMQPGYQPAPYQQQPYQQQPGHLPGGPLPQPGYGPLSSTPTTAGPASPFDPDSGLIVRAQSPDMAQAPPVGRGRYGSNIQQVDYRTGPAKPVDQFASNGNEQLTPLSTQQVMDLAWHKTSNSAVGRVVQAPFQKLFNRGGDVSQAGCSTCQTTPLQTTPIPMPVQQMAPQFTQQWQPPSQQFQPPQPQWQQPASWANATQIARGGYCNQENSIRIPLRLAEFETVNFTEQDIILEDGDIVFIASRDDENFYTGGLLGGGEYTLPRDRDLDILEAIAIAEANNRQGAGAGSSALNSDVSISPSEAIILRKLPNGTQVPILVDLYRARTRASERINIQPGDYIIVQYTKMEAVGAFIERHILESALFGVAASQFNSNR